MQTYSLISTHFFILTTNLHCLIHTNLIEFSPRNYRMTPEAILFYKFDKFSHLYFWTNFSNLYFCNFCVLASLGSLCSTFIIRVDWWRRTESAEILLCGNWNNFKWKSSFFSFLSSPEPEIDLSNFSENLSQWNQNPYYHLSWIKVEFEFS